MPVRTRRVDRQTDRRIFLWGTRFPFYALSLSLPLPSLAIEKLLEIIYMHFTRHVLWHAWARGADLSYKEIIKIVKIFCYIQGWGEETDRLTFVSLSLHSKKFNRKNLTPPQSGSRRKEKGTQFKIIIKNHQASQQPVGDQHNVSISVTPSS